MVSTRYTLARTRSRKQKISFSKGGVIVKNKFTPTSSPYGTAGTFKPIGTSYDSKFKHAKSHGPSKQNKKHGNQSKEKVKLNRSILKKSRTTKKSSVTKRVMPCKSGNKVNCTIHKKVVQNSKVTRRKNRKSPEKLEVKPKKNERKNVAINTQQGARNLNRSKTHKEGQNKPSENSTKFYETQNAQNSFDSDENNGKSPNISAAFKLSPVFFKRNIRKNLVREIKRKGLSSDSTENTHGKYPMENKRTLPSSPLSQVQSENNNSSPPSRLSTSRSNQRHQNDNVPTRNDVNSESIPNQLISLHKTCTHGSPVKSKLIVNNLTDVPNKILLSTKNSFTESTNTPDHSILQGSSCSKRTAKPISKKHRETLTSPENLHITRSSIHRHHVKTRSIAKNSKYLKNLTKQPMSSSVNHLKKTFRNQMKLKTKQTLSYDNPKKMSNKKIEKSVCSSPNKSETQKSKHKQDSKSNKKDMALNMKHRNKTMVEDLHLDKNGEKYTRRKMLTLLNKKFGSDKSSRRVKTKKSKDQRSEEEDLDLEMMKIAEDLAQVDNYVKSKILSFKLKENYLEFPQMAQKRASSVMIHKPSFNSSVTSATKKAKLILDKQLNMKVGNEQKSKKTATRRSEQRSIDLDRHQTSKKVFDDKIVSDSNIESSKIVPSLKLKEPLNHKESNDVSNEHVDSDATTSSSNSSARTKLPLTLKSKIVIQNGKKVKKKLSLKEQRIYNLLRCYGSTSLVESSPVKAQISQVNKVSNDKLIEKSAHSERQSLEKTPKSKDEDVTKEKERNKMNRETDEKKHKNYDKKKKHIGDEIASNRDDTLISNESEKNTERKDKSTKTSISNTKKPKTPSPKSTTVSPSYKEKRQQHKAKYNIAQDSGIIQSEVEKRRKSRSLKEESKSGESKEQTEQNEKVERENIPRPSNVKNKTLQHGKSKRDKSLEKYKEPSKRIKKSVVDESNKLKQKYSISLSDSECSEDLDENKEEEASLSSGIHSADVNDGSGSNTSKDTKRLVKHSEKSSKQGKVTPSSTGVYDSDSCESVNTVNSFLFKYSTLTRNVTKEKTTKSAYNSEEICSKFKKEKNLISKKRTCMDSESKNTTEVEKTLQRHFSTDDIRRKSHNNSSQSLNHLPDVVVNSSHTSDGSRNKHSHGSAKVILTSCDLNEQVQSDVDIFDDSRNMRTYNNVQNKTNSCNVDNSLTRLSAPVVVNSSHTSDGSRDKHPHGSAKVILTSFDLNEQVHSDVDIFDDSRNMNNNLQNKTNSCNVDNSSTRLSAPTKQTPVKKQLTREKINENLSDKNVKFKEIVNEHVNKYKTKDLVENLMQWSGNDNEMRYGLSPAKNKDRDFLNYRDYTTRTGITQCPVRILKKKACDELKKQMNNDYRNGQKGKDYFQCICFNKFFITRVKNKDTGNFDILNVKVKPNKSENMHSLADVQFCTFCSRLYDKYKYNFILINQEYIVREFIEKHAKSWNRLNKSYDNEIKNLANTTSNLCNLSFASTTTTTPISCESRTNSHTESRMDSSDRNDSIAMGSDYSDYYLNEVFMQNMSRDSSKLATHEFQRYRQKCRNVNMKINEICDLYKASQRRISSTETRSNVTDDWNDDSLFVRPTNVTPPGHGSQVEETSGFVNSETSRSRTSCDSQISQANTDCPRDTTYLEIERRTQPPCTPRRTGVNKKRSDSTEEDESTPPKKMKTPNSFTCSRSPNFYCSPSKKHLYKNRIEKTKESFERIFREVWKKWSPSVKGEKRFRKKDNWTDDLSSEPKFKSAHHEQSNYNKMYKRFVRKQRSLKRKNQSLMSSDFSDEYDADFSDSDGNRNVSDSSPSLKMKTSKHNEDFLNRSLGNNIIYEEKHHQYVNKLLIKHSSKHLFADKKTSYSDSEQVIKIRNVKKKVYTRIHQKVYKTRDDLSMNDHLECEFEKPTVFKSRKTCSSCNSRTKDDEFSMVRRDQNRKYLDATDGNTNYVPQEKIHKTHSLCTGQSKVTPLKEKIKQIEYENLWNKLVTDEQSGSKRKVTKETDLSDYCVETDNEKNELRTGEEDLITPQRKTAHASPDSTSQSLTKTNENVVLTTEAKESNSDDLMNEILVKKIENSTRKLNKYDNTMEEIRKYATAVRQHGEPLNKKYVLKLIKSAMKSRGVSYEDYVAVLKELNVNINLSDRNEFLIKQLSSYSEQDELIMKQCYDKLYEKYHCHQSEFSTSTIFNKSSFHDQEFHDQSDPKNIDVLEPQLTFESFKADLNNDIPVLQDNHSTNEETHALAKLPEARRDSKEMKKYQFHVDLALGDKLDIRIPLDDTDFSIMDEDCEGLKPDPSSTPEDQYTPDDDELKNVDVQYEDKAVETLVNPSDAKEENFTPISLIEEELLS